MRIEREYSVAFREGYDMIRPFKIHHVVKLI